MTNRAALRLACTLALVSVAGCGGGGKYGYAPNYVQTESEETATKGAKEYDPVMYQREPEVWRKNNVVLFGVVTSRSSGGGGTANLTLSVRRLEPRNLCENKNDDDTCRVTVSERDFGVVHALVALKGEDDVGERSVGIGSLVRVVGQFGQEVEGDGQPTMRATFYRHWPRHYYVTNANADTMRQ